MLRILPLLLLAGLGLAMAPLASADGFPAETTKPAKPAWKNGPPTEPAFFPIAVWLQNPKNAEAYKGAGINVYVGLWEGPTDDQLAALKKAGIQVICSQNAVGLQHLDDPTIIGWMHGDEPDNAQSRAEGGYGPPVSPEKIVNNYKAIVAKDATRPVILNLGQGVAWDQYIGRGVRSGHPEDYPEYIKGCDYVSFDIYPVAGETKPEVKEHLELVPFGVKRLMTWAEGKKRVWCCIECTGIDNANRKPTPREIRSEVWQALIQGAGGIIWFCHEFKPKFKEAAPLSDPDTLKAMTAINKEIKDLASVLNAPVVADGVKSASVDSKVPVAVTVRKMPDAVYVFAAASKPGKTQCSISIPAGGGLSSEVAEAEVIGEGRKVTLKGGVLVDQFQDWDVHLYKLVLQPKQPR